MKAKNVLEPKRNIFVFLLFFDFVFVLQFRDAIPEENYTKSLPSERARRGGPLIKKPPAATSPLVGTPTRAQILQLRQRQQNPAAAALLSCSSTESDTDHDSDDHTCDDGAAAAGSTPSHRRRPVRPADDDDDDDDGGLQMRMS